MARGIEIEGKMDRVQMFVGGKHRGQIMLIEDDSCRERFVDLFGILYDFPGEYNFVFYAHQKWQNGEWGIDGPGSRYCFPSPRVRERWICDLVLLEDRRTWIAKPVEFVSAASF